MTLSAFASGRIGHQQIEGSPDSEDRDHIQSPAAATSRQDMDMGMGWAKAGGQGIDMMPRGLLWGLLLVLGSIPSQSTHSTRVLWF